MVSHKLLGVHFAKTFIALNGLAAFSFVHEPFKCLLKSFNWL